MYQVQVSPSRCENKGQCLDVCPTDVFEMVKAPGTLNPLVWLKHRVHGNRVASPVREADCTGCMACVEACPEQAIVVTARGGGTRSP